MNNEVKITELTELESANVSNTDVLPIVDVSADETKKIKVQNIKTVVNDSYSTSTTETYSANYINNLPSGEGGGIIALKTITTAPSTFSEGDKYYNASDDLIYTATSSSEWDSGTTASATSLYLNEADNELYRYYNNTMNLLEINPSIQGQVLNTYNTSTTDTYSCNYINNNFQTKGTTLYNDATGSTGTITLSETSANYSYLEVYYKSAHTSGIISSKVDVSLGTANDIVLMGMSSSSATTHMYMAVCIYTLSGTSLTPTNYREYNAYNNTVDASSNKINIFKVVGYK